MTHSYKIKSILAPITMTPEFNLADAEETLLNSSQAVIFDENSTIRNELSTSKTQLFQTPYSKKRKSSKSATNIPKPKKKTKKEEALEMSQKGIKFYIADVPDDLKRQIMKGRLSYLNELKTCGSKTNKQNEIYQNIIMNFVKGRVFGSYCIDLITIHTLPIIIANEKKLFDDSLKRIKASGAAAHKFPRFDIAHANYSQETKYIEMFRSELGENATYLEWRVLVPDASRKENDVPIKDGNNSETDEFLGIVKKAKTKNKNKPNKNMEQYYFDRHNDSLAFQALCAKQDELTALMIAQLKNKE